MGSHQDRYRPVATHLSLQQQWRRPLPGTGPVHGSWDRGAGGPATRTALPGHRDQSGLPRPGAAPHRASAAGIVDGRSRNGGLGMKAIDLFAGIGGWNLALSALGIPVVLAANHSAQSLDTHRLNFPHGERATVDIMRSEER